MDTKIPESNINSTSNIFDFDDVLTESNKKRPIHTITLSVIVITIFVLLVGLFWYKLIKKGKFDSRSVQETSTKQLNTWINCSDVRDIVQDSNKLYIACLGGVMVVNVDTGEIVDEINVEDGLLSDSTTSILLINSNLYIGSQGGVDILNLQTNDHTQISTNSGLPSNNNIELAYDNENIWIGTFRGLARLSLTTGNVDTFLDDIPVDNSQVNIQNILITDKAVYAYANSNAYTRGYIARYDKYLKTWSNWGGQDLYNTFLYGLNEFQGDIFVYTSNMVFVASDGPDSKLSQSTEIINKFNNVTTSDNSYRYLGGYNEYSFIYKQKSIYRYNLKTKEIVKIASNVDFGQNGPIVNKKIYTFPLDSNKSWLVEYDGMTGLEKKVSLNRPSGFLGVHGSINSEVFVGTNKGIYLIDFSSNNPNFSSENLVTASTVFDPNFQIIQIPNSNKFGFFSQSCEMTCNNAQFIIYDYLEHTTKTENPPSDTLLKANPYNANTPLSYLGTDDRGRLIFKNTNQDLSLKWLSYDPKSGWRKEDIQPNIVLTSEKHDCSPTFQYDLQKKEIYSQANYCSKDQLNLPFSEGISSLLRLQDKYVGVYTWGGLFSYTPQSINEKK